MTDKKPYQDARDLERELFPKNPRLEKLVQVQFDRLQLARKLKGTREKVGMTQVEAAKRSGIKQPNIARLEAGSALPDLDTITRLVSAYGLTVDVEFRKAPRSRARAG